MGWDKMKFRQYHKNDEYKNSFDTNTSLYAQEIEPMAYILGIATL